MRIIVLYIIKKLNNSIIHKNSESKYFTKKNTIPEKFYIIKKVTILNNSGSNN